MGRSRREDVRGKRKDEGWKMKESGWETKENGWRTGGKENMERERGEGKERGCERKRG